MGIPEYYGKSESRLGLYAATIADCCGSGKVHIEWVEGGCVARRRFLIGCSPFSISVAVGFCSEICRYARKLKENYPSAFRPLI